MINRQGKINNPVSDDILSTQLAPAPGQTDNPVVLVPGFMASNLWTIPALPLAPPVMAWPVNLYSLTAQLYLLRAANRLEADGLVRGYYDALVEFITRPAARGGLGRIADESFWIFPYDWRGSARDSGARLSRFIRQKLAEANRRRAQRGQAPWHKADVINHSLGGFVTRAAMVLFQAPIERVVYIASPHYGVAKAYFAVHPDTVGGLVDEFITGFIPGWYWDIIKVAPNVLLLQRWASRLLASFPSIYELLPDRFYFEEEPYLIVDTRRRPARPVTGLDETYFRQPWQLTPAQQVRLKKALQFKAEMGRDLPGKHNLVIYAARQPTYARAHFSGVLEHPQKLPVGDETVTAASANHDQAARRVAVEGLHSRLPSLPEIQPLLREFLRREFDKNST